jgi:hypothetical protein
MGGLVVSTGQAAPFLVEVEKGGGYVPEDVCSLLQYVRGRLPEYT